MLIKHFVFGPIETNCYLVACEETLEAFIVDPDMRGKEEEVRILSAVNQQRLRLKYIINTHYHPDHIGGNGVLNKTTGAEILVHKQDASLLPEPWGKISEIIRSHKEPPCLACGNVGANLDIPEKQGKAVVKCDACGFNMEMHASPPADRLLSHGDVIDVGQLELVVIHTPGHSPGSISLYMEKEHIVFTGDTLFNRSIGRTDLGDSSFEDIMKSVRELMNLPDDTIVYPGHGDKTSIRTERQENPYLLAQKREK